MRMNGLYAFPTGIFYRKFIYKDTYNKGSKKQLNDKPPLVILKHIKNYIFCIDYKTKWNMYKEHYNCEIICNTKRKHKKGLKTNFPVGIYL